MPKCWALWQEQAPKQRFEMSGFAAGVRFRSSKIQAAQVLSHSALRKLELRNRTESPQVWRYGTRNLFLALT